ncbi:MAG: hypothetical protein AAF556_08990 [Pseudomonadota bacterium]
MKGEINSGNGFTLAAALNQNLAWYKDGDYQLCLDKLREEIEANPEHNILYSSEHLFNFQPQQLAKFVADADRLGLEVSVIFWVREVIDHAISAYSQLLKRHRYTETFSFYLSKNHKFEWNKVWRDLTAILPADRISTANYGYNIDRVLPRFCQQLGVPAPTDLDIPQTVNRSLTIHEIEVMRYLNQHGHQSFNTTMFNDLMLARVPTGPKRDFVTAEEYALASSLFGDKIAQFNSLVERNILVLKSDRIRVGEGPVITLTDMEKTLLGLIADQMIVAQQLTNMMQQRIKRFNTAFAAPNSPNDT